MTEQIGQSANPIEIRSSQGDSLIINPLGGKVKLELGNVLILTSVVRGDGKTGETHPCTPIFGPDKKNLYGLIQHGKTRTEQLEVKKDSENGAIVTHNITDSPDRYPSGVRVEQQLSIKDGRFDFKMTHTNGGTIPAPVNSGEHLYFAAPQGYKGVSLNGKDITALIEADTAIPLEAATIIEIPGLPKLRLNQKGFNYVMLWVGKNAEGVRDGNYVCIEPVEGNPSDSYFGSLESIIKPGNSRTATFTISVEKAAV
jgi:galactose mutarotase-like enzyme